MKTRLLNWMIFGMFIAGASLAGAADPLDDWARRTVPGLSVNLNAVAFGNGAFVAVGNNSTVARSTDGINWTVSTPGAYGNLVRVRFLEGEFVVLGSSDRILVSTDGLSWTEHTLPSANFYDIAYGNGRYVIIGPTSYVSTNGVDWAVTNPRLPNPGHQCSVVGIDSIAFGNGRFVTIGRCFFAESQPSVYSTNGVDWTMGTTAAPTTVTAGTGDLLFAGGLFLGTGARDAGPNGVYVTTNGTAWCCNFAGTSIGGSYGAGLAYGQGTYLWVLQNIPQFTSWPYLYTSENGTTWVTRFLPMTVFPGNPNYAYYESMKGKALGAAFGNGTFVVVGEAGYIIQSGNIGGTPLILQEPADRGAVAGNPASFSINVSGAQPLAYQWFHSGAAITDATNATVTIAHVTPGDIGGYQVVVTNSFGSVTSRVAQLTVSFLDIKMYAGIEILGIAGRTYRIEGTAATGPVNWQTLTNLILPSSPYTWIDPGSPAAGARLYRAAELP